MWLYRVGQLYSSRLMTKVVSLNPVWAVLNGVLEQSTLLLFLLTQVYKWVQGFAGMVTGSLCFIVQRTGNSLTATLCIEKSGPITSEKEIGISGCSEKCPHPIYLFPFTELAEKWEAPFKNQYNHVEKIFHRGVLSQIDLPTGYF